MSKWRTQDVISALLLPVLIAGALLVPAWVVHNQNRSTQLQIQTAVCAEHETLLTLKKIGDRLGIPTKDIVLPAIDGLNCAGA